MLAPPFLSKIGGCEHCFRFLAHRPQTPKHSPLGFRVHSSCLVLRCRTLRYRLSEVNRITISPPCLAHSIPPLLLVPMLLHSYYSHIPMFPNFPQIHIPFRKFPIDGQSGLAPLLRSAYHVQAGNCIRLNWRPPATGATAPIGLPCGGGSLSSSLVGGHQPRAPLLRSAYPAQADPYMRP